MACWAAPGVDYAREPLAPVISASGARPQASDPTTRIRCGPGGVLSWGGELPAKTVVKEYLPTQATYLGVVS